MTDAFFDTTVFVDLQNGDPDARELLVHLTRRSTTAFFSPITTYDFGYARWHALKRRNVMHFLSLCTEVPFNGSAARVMADWLRRQPRAGRRRLLGDAMIAATAASLGATIYTRNPRDFARFYPHVQAY